MRRAAIFTMGHILEVVNNGSDFATFLSTVATTLSSPPAHTGIRPSVSHVHDLAHAAFFELIF
jgi:hypothetical protein